MFSRQLLEKAHQLILKAKKHNYSVKSMKKKSRKSSSAQSLPSSAAGEEEGDYEPVAAPLCAAGNNEFPERPPSLPDGPAAAGRAAQATPLSSPPTASAAERTAAAPAMSPPSGAAGAAGAAVPARLPLSPEETPPAGAASLPPLDEFLALKPPPLKPMKTMAELKRFAPPSFSSFGNSPGSFADNNNTAPQPKQHSAAYSSAVSSDVRDASVGFKSKGAAKGAAKAADGSSSDLAAAFGAYGGVKGTPATYSDVDHAAEKKK
jgi:hypothetical protein